ncbi:hypothetical protein [Paraglaciecola chathamensis]|uniref:Lipoprotein n=1 Tax=Paraglaciecola agarilytica NO2 TaxID=1125747 RepID=A0ABQ0IBL7_9ALTE|nr:hypothetical protein [Paraglaciecola agarilytica]GAC06787.1 hypothetical protein GAGA_3954 [Paraglaciecola agarilytica NO2]
MNKLTCLIVTFVLIGCSSMTDRVEFNEPNENFIDIEGSLSESITYKVAVQYVAKSESKQCKNYNWLAGLYVSQSETFDYWPSVSNGQHHLHIPLKELSPDTKCQWEPNIISICANSVGKNPSACSSLFFLRGQHDNNSEINVECSDSGFCFRVPFDRHTEDINILNKTYSVNINKKET